MQLIKQIMIICSIKKQKQKQKQQTKNNNNKTALLLRSIIAKSEHQIWVK